MYIALAPVIAICDQHSGAFWRMETKLQRPLLQQPIKWRPFANANKATATISALSTITGDSHRHHGDSRLQRPIQSRPLANGNTI